MSRERKPLPELLGGFVPSAFKIRKVHPLATPGLGNTRCLQLGLERRDGVLVRALMTGPPGEWAGLPALLYCHAHGGRYEIGASELIQSRPALQPEPYAKALADRGIVALAIDLPCFGARATEPESLAAKRHLWHGTTLFGEMLMDLSGAIQLLEAWPGLAPGRIGAFGISMGATLAFWLAALDSRVRCLAHLCCFADLAELVRLNGHDRHGLYMTVPGLVSQWRTGEIAGLAAPRPQFVALGAKDPLTPPSALERALADVQDAYAAADAGAHFEALIDLEADHVETPEMRERVLRFFDSRL